MQSANPSHIALRDALVGQVLRGSAGTGYHLRERFGEGGQGWVFKANWDEPTGLLVIVKVLRPDVVHSESLTRFQREAEVLRLLSQQPRPNPHIVRFYDHAVAHFQRPGTGERVALPFTVLEYVNGPTLEQVLRPLRGTGLPVERVRRIGKQVVHALELVHAQKVVHRDLKPSNILLANEQGTEVAKVTDFGLVKLVDLNVQRTTTLAGASLGYAPPEQFEQGNQRVSPRTDVFSLAAILFEMLAGSPAFPFTDRENPLIIVSRILAGPRPSLLPLRAQLGRNLRDRTDLLPQMDAVLARGMRGDPAERPESVSEFWSQLEPLLLSAGGASDRPPAPRLAFADTDLARTRPSVPGGDPQTLVSGLPSGLPASHVRINAQGSPTNPAAMTPSARSPASAANPAAWTAHLVTKPIRAGLVRGAAFGPDGESAVATGPTALARWERGTWAGLALPPHIDVRLVRGVRFLSRGELLLFGERSLAARLGPSVADVWSLPDPDLTFSAAHIDPDGTITLVGERALRRAAAAQPEAIGAVAQLSGPRVVFVADAPTCTRLNGVTRLSVQGKPAGLIACGDWGNLARIDGTAVERAGAVCQGHLVAIAATEDGGALTVGAGGHALRLSPRLEPTLEAVQTTRDLGALAIGPDGVAWAGAAQARLLRRTPEAWVRISGDVGITPSIVSIWASDRLVRAICDDAAVLEWRLT